MIHKRPPFKDLSFRIRIMNPIKGKGLGFRVLISGLGYSLLRFCNKRLAEWDEMHVIYCHVRMEKLKIWRV